MQNAKILSDRTNVHVKMDTSETDSDVPISTNAPITHTTVTKRNMLTNGPFLFTIEMRIFMLRLAGCILNKSKYIMVLEIKSHGQPVTAPLLKKRKTT